jgi:hypothetical protein
MEQVQNAIDFLTMIGALDEKENLTNLGESVFLSYSVGCLRVYCYLLVFVVFLIYFHFLSIREISLDTSC